MINMLLNILKKFFIQKYSYIFAYRKTTKLSRLTTKKMKLYHGTEECLIDNDDLNNFISNFADNHLSFLSTSKEVAFSYTKKNGIANLFEFDCNFNNVIEFDCKELIWDSEELSEIFELKTGVFATCPDDLSFLLSEYDAVIFRNISDIGSRKIKNYIGDTVMINSNKKINFVTYTNE